MWKLGWFLRDFLYDPESLTRDEIDEKALRGLIGVVKISHTVVNGASLVNFDGFAPASQWEELSAGLKRSTALQSRTGGREEEGIVMTYSYSSDFAIPDLPASLPSPLSGWLAGKRAARLDAVRAGLRTSCGCAVSPRRSGGSLVRAVERVQAAGSGLSGSRNLGQHAAARRASARRASFRTVGSASAGPKPSSRFSSTGR